MLMLWVYDHMTFKKRYSFLITWSIFVKCRQNSQKESIIKFGIVWRLLMAPSLKGHIALIKLYQPLLESIMVAISKTVWSTLQEYKLI